jgi:hypothetical protein
MRRQRNARRWPLTFAGDCAALALVVLTVGVWTLFLWAAS